MGRDERQNQELRLHAHKTLAMMVDRNLGEPVPFNDHEQCAKCGALEHHVIPAWCPGFSDMHPNAENLPCKLVGEHLHKRCERCGYEWRMWCKDDDRNPPDAEDLADQALGLAAAIGPPFTPEEAATVSDFFKKLTGRASEALAQSAAG